MVVLVRISKDESMQQLLKIKTSPTFHSCSVTVTNSLGFVHIRTRHQTLFSSSFTAAREKEVILLYVPMSPEG